MMAFSVQLKINGKFCLLVDTDKHGNRPTYDNEENLSDAALHKIIVENKFQPPTNENRIISHGVQPSGIQKLYKWPLFTKNTKLIMSQFKINTTISYTLKTNLKEPSEHN